MSVFPVLLPYVIADLQVGRALLGTLVFGSLAIILPNETPISKGEKMDWIGSVLGISGFIAFNFVWKYVPIAPLSASRLTYCSS